MNTNLWSRPLACALGLVPPLLLCCGMPISTPAQSRNPLPRFENFPITEIFNGTPTLPILATPEARRFRTRITEGITKGVGVEDGATGKELGKPGPNFAGHYTIVRWGCGSPCLMIAIIDLKTGRIFPPPFHHGPGHSYFQLPWAFPMEPPLAYRTDSRLLMANICESAESRRVESGIVYEDQRCGAHYFVMTESGPRLIHKVLEP